MIFIVFGCALKDELIERARAGDLEAIAQLIGALPADLPLSFRNAERTRRIRNLATGLRAALPAWRNRPIAELLEFAGQRREAKLRLSGVRFAELTDAELRHLEGEIDRILSWAPARAGTGWLGWRQIFEIIRTP